MTVPDDEMERFVKVSRNAEGAVRYLTPDEIRPEMVGSRCRIVGSPLDGVRTIEETLRILSRYETMGVREVWLTPHVMEDTPNTTVHLRQRFEELGSAYKGGISLHLAAENMLDALFEERLTAGDLLPIGEGGEHLLVETSCWTPPRDLYGILRRVMRAGLRPVLAHPERYAYMEDADYARLRGMGVVLQLNLFSLVGLYGDGARRRARRLLREGMYGLVGSDIHSTAYLGTPLTTRVAPLRDCRAAMEIKNVLE